jgi:hypothetical protein
MVTLLLMGGATFLIGCIPSYETIGFMAPVLVLILRMLQVLGRRIWRSSHLCSGAAPVGQREILDFLDTNHCNCGVIHFINGNSSNKKHPNTRAI